MKLNCDMSAQRSAKLSSWKKLAFEDLIKRALPRTMVTGDQSSNISWLGGRRIEGTEEKQKSINNTQNDK